jgi:site-specific DNA recombinase
VKDWKRRGIKTVNGGQWRSSHVRTMLLSPAIAGKTQYNGQYFDAKERVNDEWVPVSPIVPFEKWQRLRDLLTDPARTMTKGANNQKYLLTGVLRCGLCGGRMAGTIKRRYVDGKSISAQRIYNCPLSMGGCNRINRQADAVEGLILKAIFQAVESPTWDARVRESSSDDDAVQQLLERRAEVTGLLDRLQDKLARELIGEPAYRRNRVELEDELAAINRQLSRLQDDSVVPAVPRNLRQVWDDLAFDRQRSIIAVVLRATGRRLVVYPQANRWFDPDSVKLEPVEAPA